MRMLDISRTSGRFFLASRPRKVMVSTVVMPSVILSEVASLLSQNGTQEMTTISMQGPYTCTRAKCSQVGLSLVESFGVLKYFQSDLNDEVPHVSLEMESDHQRGVISWDKTAPDCTAGRCWSVAETLEAGT